MVVALAQRAAMSGIGGTGTDGSKLTSMTLYPYVPHRGTIEASCRLRRRKAVREAGGGKGWFRDVENSRCSSQGVISVARGWEGPEIKYLVWEKHVVPRRRGHAGL